MALVKVIVGFLVPGSIVTVSIIKQGSLWRPQLVHEPKTLSSQAPPPSAHFATSSHHLSDLLVSPRQLTESKNEPLAIGIFKIDKDQPNSVEHEFYPVHPDVAKEHRF